MKNSQNRGNGNTRRSARGRGSARHDLTARQKLFCLEYLKDLNATQAAIRAGYARKDADVQGPRLLGNVRIQREIQTVMNQRVQRVEAEGDETLRAIRNLGHHDPRRLFDDKGNLKEIHEMDADTAKTISSFDFVTLYEGNGDEKHAYGQVRKIRLRDSLKALELEGRHKELFVDRVEHGVDDETRKLLADKLDVTNATEEQLRELATLGTAGVKGQGEGRAVPAEPIALASEPHKDKG